MTPSASGSRQVRRRGGPVFSRRQALTAAGSVAVSVLVAGCRDDGPRARPAAPPPPVPVGGGGAGPLPPPAAGANGVEVDVQSIDNTFRPDRVEISPGTTVVWTNFGRTEHDILPAEGDEWGVQPEAFPPGATFRHVFTEPGEVPYYCSIHGTMRAGMVGTIVVLTE